MLCQHREKSERRAILKQTGQCTVPVTELIQLLGQVKIRVQTENFLVIVRQDFYQEHTPPASLEKFNKRKLCLPK